MSFRLRAAVAGAVLSAVSVPAYAGGTDFGYVYTVSTEEKGETELSLWATDRRGKAQGRGAGAARQREPGQQETGQTFHARRYGPIRRRRLECLCGSGRLGLQRLRHL